MAKTDTCMWCDGSVEVTDESHVLPECFGNNKQQVLPPGIVCKQCNSYFGSKVEPALIADPMIHALCVGRRIVDPGDGNVFRDKLFDSDHPASEPIHRSLSLNLAVNAQSFELAVEYNVNGKIRFEYNRKKVALISRAIHKLGFESLVWELLQGRIEAPVDVASDQFQNVKRWVREGQPRHRVRPFARRPEVESSPHWETRIRRFDDQLAVEIRLFGDWFLVSLTSDPSSAAEHLRSWCSGLVQKAWLIGERFEPISGGA